MIYTQHYDSPLGGILLAADDIGLTGLWFEGQKYFARTLDAVHQEQETAVLSEARRWLDVYFGGQKPDFTPVSYTHLGKNSVRHLLPPDGAGIHVPDRRADAGV